MKNMIRLAVLLFITVATDAAHAQSSGSAEDAMAMVQRAVAYIKENGREKALAEFIGSNPKFKQGDLYIFVTSSTGTMLAHGTNPKLVGKDLIDLKDADGKLFVKSYIELANSKGKGWVDYKWPNPVDSTIQIKSTYIEKLDDMIVGCGIYKK